MFQGKVKDIYLILEVLHGLSIRVDEELQVGSTATLIPTAEEIIDMIHKVQSILKAKPRGVMDGNKGPGIKLGLNLVTEGSNTLDSLQLNSIALRDLTRLKLHGSEITLCQ